MESGHLRIDVTTMDGVRHLLLVHRLVLLAFTGAPPSGKPNGLHWDDDPTNNDLSNLYWGSHAENARDAKRNGRHYQSNKVTCNRGHDLVEPNLIAAKVAAGLRSCRACGMTSQSRWHDSKARAAGREPRYGHRLRASDFLRQAGELFEEEADRRYRYIMGISD